jgi:hyperosmotically inducible periplasmic protein
MRPYQYNSRPTRIVFAALLCGLFVAFFATSLSGAPAGKQAQQDYVSREVGHVLVLLPFYSVFDILQYSVNGDRVILKGAVIHTTLKADAEASVKKIEGVESVDNEIEILPVSAADDQIRRAEFRAIYSTPNLNRYAQSAVLSIHIIVKNGHVSLEGIVDSQGDKDAAGIAANSVPNVFSVTNDLVVQRGR